MSSSKKLDEFLIPFVTKAQIVKSEKGAMLISIQCPRNDIDVLKREVIEKPARAVKEAVKKVMQTTAQRANERVTRDEELKRLLHMAIEELKQDREKYTANAKQELGGIMMKATGGIVQKLTALEQTVSNQTIRDVQIHTAQSEEEVRDVMREIAMNIVGAHEIQHTETRKAIERLEAKIDNMLETTDDLVEEFDQLKNYVVNNTMAQQRRHKGFSEYVWNFNNSTMQQLSDIAIRQAEFNTSCKPTLQNVVNYTNRRNDGVEL